jgi:hypothetical protein
MGRRSSTRKKTPSRKTFGTPFTRADWIGIAIVAAVLLAAIIYQLTLDPVSWKLILGFLGLGACIAAVLVLHRLVPSVFHEREHRKTIVDDLETIGAFFFFAWLFVMLVKSYYEWLIG